MGLSLSLFIFMPLLFLLSQLLLILTHSSPFVQPLCHHDDSSALLQFKESFIINKSASVFDPNCQKFASWRVEGDKSDCCSWDGVECDDDTGHVIGLNLGSSCLYGSINSTSSLFRLVHLQRLNLAYNHFNYSQIPSQIRDLSRLTDLNLSFSQFSGQIPLEISQLSHLSSLNLSPFPYPAFLLSYPPLELKTPGLRSIVGNLTRLQKLDLSGVTINSTIPNSLANLSSLTFLNLEYCGLHGKFPVGIFKLSNLRYLSMYRNEGLTGYLPSFTWSSPLETLVLSYTSFSGELPYSIGNLSFLTELHMSGCNFFGSIPSSLGNLTKLTLIYLSSSGFVGNIPPSLRNLVQLSDLVISNNQLTGPVPFRLVNLPQLNYADLSYNLLSGELHFGLMNQTQLEILDLSNNRFTGPVPFGPMNFTQLSILDLSANNLHGQISNSIFNLKNLEILDLSENYLNGIVDFDEFVKLRHLRTLHISGNQLSLLTKETSPNATLQKFKALGFSSCNLKIIKFSQNKFQGHLPRSLAGCAMLQVLDLSDNQLDDTFSSWFENLSNLEVLVLRSNKFHGHVPRSLAKCTMLKVLDLSDNKFVDRFPFWLGRLPNLKVLILRLNKFNGPMGTLESNLKFSNLQILDISYNNFIGKLPSGLFENWKARKFENLHQLTYFDESSDFGMRGLPSYDWGPDYTYSMLITNKGRNVFYEKVPTLFTAIDFSNNRFVGEISESIENLRGFHLLNLSNNYLTGHIPSSLGNLIELEALDLSHNNLSGEIPQQLTQLTFLGFLNVSHNNLTGLIPQGKQFDTFENNSFEGNPGLCGKPLTRKCGNFDELPSQPSIFEESQDSESPFAFGWKIVVIGYGFGFAIGVIIGQIVIARKHDWLMKTLRIRPVIWRRHKNK